MKTVPIREAQHHFSKLLEMVRKGEEVVITRRGVEVAVLTAIEKVNPAEREMDWSESVSSVREHLKEMPDVGESLVLQERESYEW